ncbi:MAG: helix-turn-helix transcriptional regulator [Saprospiraceae bacterium]|nr:helix-turn-helix transcriptional regulator [Saprospiraceae bacterium]
MNSLSTPALDIMTWLIGAVTLHGVYLSFLLLLRSGNQGLMRWLAVTILLISLVPLNYLLFLTGIIWQAPHLLGVFIPAFYLIGVSFYFLAVQMVRPEFRLKPIHALHLLPFVFFLLRFVPLYYQSADYKLQVIDAIFNAADRPPILDFLLGNLPLFHITAYAMVVWILLAKNSRDTRLQWLQNFTKGFVFLLVSDVLIQLLFWTMDWNGALMEMLLAACVAGAIHALGYFIIKPVDLFKPAPVLVSISKYRTSPLSSVEIENRKKTLLELLEKEKPYLRAELKISDLAGMMGIPSHHLSQVLNEGMHINFYDLINDYRITEIKKRLKDPKYGHFSILAIALDCGFSNKTSFNRTFKKLTGMTPTEYMNSYEQAIKVSS